MKREWEPRQSRARTHIKFYTEQYLWGSTRSELTPDERSVWIDFLSLASTNYGEVECFSRDQLAQQLLIPRELLDRSIDKFIKYGKVKRKYNKREKKEIFCIVKWDLYQADYLKKRAKKSSSYKDIKRIEKQEETDTENQPTLQERKGEEITLQNITLKENGPDDSEDSNKLNPNHTEDSSPLHSNSFNDRGMTIKEQFLLMLKSCKEYPFNEEKDSLLFDITIKELPNIKILEQTDKKILWWKNHPEALKANPRKQLWEWFEGEFEFQKRGGPQKIGEILKDIHDPDLRNWAKQLIGLAESKEKKPKRNDYE